jgi:L-threonylcarbamoyladenylate synthase
MSQTHIFKLTDITETEIKDLARALEQGAVAVVPTDTVYGLATGAYCETSIQRIYQLKNRPAASPLQILAGSLARAQEVAQFSSGAEKMAHRFWPGALTMVLPSNSKGQALTRGFAGLGIRIPGNVFLQKILGHMSGVLACTSANLHGQTVVTQEEILLNTFNGKVDYIVLSGTLSPVASSVVDLTDKPRLLREGAISRAALEDVLQEQLN